MQLQLINFADPAYAAFPGMTAEKVQGGLDEDIAALNALGYDAKLCLTDFGETAEAVLRATLQQKRYDCVVIGAGVRTIDKNFLLAWPAGYRLAVRLGLSSRSAKSNEKSTSGDAGSSFT